MAASRRARRIDPSFAIILLISVASAAAVLAREGAAVALEVLREDAILFLEVLPKVLAGTLIGALVRILVPRAAVRRLIGEGSGITGLLVATLAGALFPGGPFTIFPLAAAFLIAGADRGAAVAFITSWLLLGFNRALVWEMPFLGADLVGLRMLLSLPMPLAAGLLARAAPAHIAQTGGTAP